MNRVIIFIDDDPVFNIINEKLVGLLFNDIKVSCFLKPESALNFIQSKHADEGLNNMFYIFLDINMPNTDGWGFLEQCRHLPEEIKSHINFYLLTSSVSPSDIARSKKFNEVHEFVSKPLTKDILLRIFNSPN